LSTGKRAAIKGSERAAVPGATEVGSVDIYEKIELSLVLRPNSDSLPALRRLINESSTSRGEPKRRPYLSREEFGRSYGANTEDIVLIKNFAGENNIDLVETGAPRRTIKLSGECGKLCNLFGIELKRYQHPRTKGTFRGRIGPLYAPAEVSPVIQAVLGLDDRPQAKTHFRPLLPGQAAISSYTPPDLAKLYDFPQLDGNGESIGIIELGGGYNQSDIDSYFASLGINTPRIVTVPIDGAENAPTGDPSGPDGEVTLDIEVAGSIAPDAQITVYFAPNTDKGFLDAVTTAIQDKQNKPSAISISWGSAEDSWTSQAMQSLNQAFQNSTTLGITVCAASGDNGSSDGETDGLSHVDFPASSPYVLGCGGTRLNSNNRAITSEVVWNDQSIGGGATGGGISDTFALPSWQANANVPPSANPGKHVGRGVPDVCADADPATGYMVLVGGQSTVFGGTSAVAPLWASLLVLINQNLGHPVGYVNPFFYEKLVTRSSTSVKEQGFDDITQGNNGAYSARPGWDACTGLGSPDGLKLLKGYTSG
jgi:kumamolisin